MNDVWVVVDVKDWEGIIGTRKAKTWVTTKGFLSAFNVKRVFYGLVTAGCGVITS